MHPRPMAVGVSVLEMVPSPSCGVMDDLRRSLSPFSGRPPLGGGIA